MELEELFPDHRFADAGGRFDDLVFIEFVAAILEEVINYKEVYEGWFTFGGELIKLCQQRRFSVGGSRQCVPHLREPTGE